jgi:hypothetical protein
VHDSLWNPLVIEVGDLFAQDEIFQRSGTAVAGSQ